MLSRMRKTYDAAFKAKVAFEAAKGEKTNEGPHCLDSREALLRCIEDLPVVTILATPMPKSHPFF